MTVPNGQSDPRDQDKAVFVEIRGSFVTDADARILGLGANGSRAHGFFAPVTTLKCRSGSAAETWLIVNTRFDPRRLLSNILRLPLLRPAAVQFSKHNSRHPGSGTSNSPVHCYRCSPEQVIEY